MNIGDGLGTDIILSRDRDGTIQCWKKTDGKWLLSKDETNIRRARAFRPKPNELPKIGTFRYKGGIMDEGKLVFKVLDKTISERSRGFNCNVFQPAAPGGNLAENNLERINKALRQKMNKRGFGLKEDVVLS